MNSMYEPYKSTNNTLTSTPSIVCAGVVAINETDKIMYWTFNTIDGTRLYTSDPQYQGYNFAYNLGALGLEDWTQLVVAAIAPDGSIITSDIVLQYYSQTRNTAYFDFFEVSETFIVQQANTLTHKVINNEITITGYTGLDSFLVIPETIEYLPVTAIDSFAFHENSILRTISTTNVKSVGDFAFASCPLLEAITMPKVEKLGNNVFYDSSNLKSVDSPSLTFVGSSCFRDCTALQEIHLPKVSTIADFVFLQSGIEYIDIPNIESIGTQSFSHCEYLTDLNISKKLTTVGFNLFLGSELKNLLVDYGTDSINTVTLADWNKYVSALSESDLSTITGKLVKNTSSFKDVANQLFYGYIDDGLMLTDYTGNISNLILPGYIIRKEVTDIAYYVFNSASSLNSITMPNISYIGPEAFENCSSLKNVTAPKLENIGYGAFNRCTLLESISIPNVTYIDTLGFGYCQNLTSIELKNTNRLVSPSFYLCSSLEKVIISKYVTVTSREFEGCPINCLTIYYGKEDISNVTTIDWNNFVLYLGINPNDIPGKYVMNETEIRDVADRTPPVITLIGDNPLSVEIGTHYYEPGAIVTDEVNPGLPAEITGFVDTTKIGTNYVYYNATDYSGNKATEVVRTVNVVDIAAPVITLNGNNPMNVEINTPYHEPGAVVTDNCDTGLQAVITGSVDTTKFGSNYIHYNATDYAGNKATEVIRTVNVVDTTAPVITLNGDNPMKVEINTSYHEPGAVVTDNFDTGLQAIITGSVDSTKLGINSIHYNATDHSGNKATEVVRTVNVIDTTAPVITLNGDNFISLEVKTPYVEAGAVVTDNVDTDLQPVITGSVDITKLGSNIIHYNATDHSGNKATEVVRTVNVIDTTSPIITLNGENPMTVAGNSPYIEPGAVVSDNFDTNLQPVITGEVDTSIAGEYLVYYNATDSSGNKGTQVVRTVNVVDTTIPVIILKGSNPMAVEVNTPYVEPGAVVVDDVDNDLEPVITGSVDTTTLGDYYIYYNATDSSGNKANEVSRLVSVADTISPIITLNGDYRVYLSLNTPYIEQGAVVTDNFDTNLQPIITGYVDITVAGEYHVYYNATDSSGNKATEVMRTVYIHDPLSDFCYTINNNEVIITCYRGANPNVVIPETIENLPVTTIDSYAFASSYSVLSINTSNVTTINDFAFSYCASLVAVIMPEVRVIKDYGLASCKNLRFVGIPQITTINTMAFANCVTLKSINISKNLSSIGTEIFSGSTLENITIDYGTEDISNINIYQWTQFVSKLTGWDLTTVPGKYVKNNLYTKDLVNGLTYKEYPSSLTVIDYVGTVADLKLPEAINLKPVVAIDNYVFQYFDSLYSIIMPNVTTVGMYAFSSCLNLNSIIGNKVTTLGVASIQSCGKLINLTLPKLTTIDQRTFSYLTSLSSVSFPELTTIKGDAAFSGCTILKSVDLPTLTSTGNYTFASCINLTDISMPLVKTIGKGVFSICSALEEIDLSQVTRVDDYAFYQCLSLNKVIISKDATVGTDVFKDCSIINVTIYYGTEEISSVTIDDWNSFVSSMGLVPDNIPGKYVMNDYGIRDLSK